jgi:hypothetical protein
MENERLISAHVFCSHYHVELAFINALKEYGLIELTAIEDDYFIDRNELLKLEQYTRWHYDLEINLQGIEVIEHLLNRVRSLQDEIKTLKNELKLYNEKNPKITGERPGVDTHDF